MACATHTHSQYTCVMKADSTPARTLSHGCTSRLGLPCECRMCTHSAHTLHMRAPLPVLRELLQRMTHMSSTRMQKNNDSVAIRILARGWAPQAVVFCVHGYHAQLHRVCTRDTCPDLCCCSSCSVRHMTTPKSVCLCTLPAHVCVCVPCRLRYITAPMREEDANNVIGPWSWEPQHADTKAWETRDCSYKHTPSKYRNTSRYDVPELWCKRQEVRRMSMCPHTGSPRAAHTASLAGALGHTQALRQEVRHTAGHNGQCRPLRSGS